MFPTESLKTFYVGSKSKAVSRTNESMAFRGKLVDMYRNKLRQMKVLVKIEKIPETEVSRLESDNEDVEKKVEHSIEWLNVHLNP
ncbi:hypothetical protein PV327_011298 [Microctonus hyperodae]|uniref:Uncharacterized protein n=1 Tax=Microctonus hyperodae TaxID=165561 RepID=A0AA39C3N4_MICHY|nr:hypothetical protein PV327_011298 [Microctonus hyperodae]